jgi:hypothetical protein
VCCEDDLTGATFKLGAPPTGRNQLSLRATLSGEKRMITFVDMLARQDRVRALLTRIESLDARTIRIGLTSVFIAVSLLTVIKAGSNNAHAGGAALQSGRSGFSADDRRACAEEHTVTYATLMRVANVQAMAKGTDFASDWMISQLGQRGISDSCIAHLNHNYQGSFQ